MRFSVEVSSSLSCIMFWFAFRSGYASATTISRESAPASPDSAPPSAAIAAGSPGFALAAARPLTAAARAWITASSVSRSCLR